MNKPLLTVCCEHKVLGHWQVVSDDHWAAKGKGDIRTSSLIIVTAIFTVAPKPLIPGMSSIER
jgi:hypothetical protein